MHIIGFLFYEDNSGYVMFDNDAIGVCCCATDPIYIVVT